MLINEKKNSSFHNGTVYFQVVFNRSGFGRFSVFGQAQAVRAGICSVIAFFAAVVKIHKMLPVSVSLIGRFSGTLETGEIVPGYPGSMVKRFVFGGR